MESTTGLGLAEAARTDYASAQVWIDVLEERGDHELTLPLRERWATVLLEERWQRACSARGRFAGRAELERKARGDVVALAKLELRLGLADEAAVEAARQDSVTGRLVALATAHYTPLDERNEALGYLWAGPSRREHVAAVRYASATNEYAKRVASLVSYGACAAIEGKRTNRRHRRSTRAGDPLFARTSGYAAQQIAERRLRDLLERAGYREATHSHETRIASVARGEENVRSDTGSARPRDVGLPNAYAKRGYFVTTSLHVWFVSPAILSPEVRALQALAPHATIYFRVDLRIVQGRGTSLTLQRRGERGGWS